MLFQEKDEKQEKALSRLLDEYQEQEQIWKQELPQEMEDQAEVLPLYAEYAIDFVTQTMRHALITALTAVILQQRAETEPEETVKKEKRYE